MRAAFALALMALCAACAPAGSNARAPEAGPREHPAQSAPSAAASPTAAPPRDLAPRVSTVTTRTATSPVDIAPAAPASASLPLGSVYVATILTSSRGGEAHDEPTLFEWDVAGERVLAQKKLAVPHDGAPAGLRIAAASDRVFAVTEYLGLDRKPRLTVMNRALGVLADTDLPAGSSVSIEAAGSYVAVAVAGDDAEARPLTITLFDARSLRPIARRDLAASATMSAVRPDVLELVGERLYAVGMPAAASFPRDERTGAVRGESTIFAFELPSLTPRESFTTGVPAAYVPRLGARAEHLAFAAGGKLIELTKDLRPVRTTDLESEAFAFGPKGEPLTRSDWGEVEELFPKATAPCASAWSGSTPLVACSDADGVHVARLTTARATRAR